MGPSWKTVTYSDPVPCQECGGSGKVALLVTARACDACGSRRVWPDPRREHVPPKLGYIGRERTFDALGRLISESRWCSC